MRVHFRSCHNLNGIDNPCARQDIWPFDSRRSFRSSSSIGRDGWPYNQPSPIGLPGNWCTGANGANVINAQIGTLGAGGVAAICGLIVFVLIQAFGDVSGAYLNPVNFGTCAI